MNLGQHSRFENRSSRYQNIKNTHKVSQNQMEKQENTFENQPHVSKPKTQIFKTKDTKNLKLYEKIKIGQNFQKQIDYGIFNKYRLDQFFNIQKNIQQGQVIPIVTLSSHALHLQEKFLNLMQQYNYFQLGFVGVYGPKNGGKSLFLDKILNLATFQGSHFTQPKIPKRKKQVCLWSIPIMKGKQKIFIVDCTGFEMGKYILDEDRMLCDFMLLLCSEIVLIQPFNQQGNGDQIQRFKEMLLKSTNRMKSHQMNKQNDLFYWPGFLSIAYRNQPKQQYKKLKGLFQRIDFKKLSDGKDSKVEKSLSDENLKQIKLEKYVDKKKLILNENYIRTVAQYLQQFYQNCQPKFYQSIRPNGNGLSNLLLNVVIGINCRQKMSMHSIIQKTKKQILVQSFNSSASWYSRQLQKYLNKEQPMSSNQLLQIFKQVFHKVFAYFKKRICLSLKIDPTDKLTINKIAQLQQKLEIYIREKQRLIVKINEKKTSKTIKKQVDQKINISKMPLQSIIDLRQILYRLKTIQRHLDSNRLTCFKSKLISGWNKFITSQQSKYLQQIQSIQEKVSTKRYQLKVIKEKIIHIQTQNAQNAQKFTKLNRIKTQLQEKIQTKKMQLKIHKNINLQKLQNSYQRIHMTSRNQQELTYLLKQYRKKLKQRSIQREKELKILKQELQQAYKIQAEQINKLCSLPDTIPLNSYKLQRNESMPNIGKKINQDKQSPIKAKQQSNRNLPSLQEMSFVDKNVENKEINPLLKSRIAKNTQSLKLLKYQIEQKAKSQQELQNKISSKFLALSRLTTEYKNNQIRGSQSRKIKLQNSQKKQTLKNPKINDLQTKRLFQPDQDKEKLHYLNKGIFTDFL